MPQGKIPIFGANGDLISDYADKSSMPYYDIENIIIMKKGDSYETRCRPRHGTYIGDISTSDLTRGPSDSFQINNRIYYTINDAPCKVIMYTGSVSTPYIFTTVNSSSYIISLGDSVGYLGDSYFAFKPSNDNLLPAFSQTTFTTVTMGNGETGAGRIVTFGAYLFCVYSIPSPKTKIFFSAPGDLTSWDALDFISPDGTQVTAAMALDDKIYISTEKKIYAYYQTGTSDAPFAIINGLEINNPCVGANLICTDGNNIYYIDINGALCVIENGQYNILDKQYAKRLLDNGVLGNPDYSSLKYQYIYGKRFVSLVSRPTSTQLSGSDFRYDLDLGFSCRFFNRDPDRDDFEYPALPFVNYNPNTKKFVTVEMVNYNGGIYAISEILLDDNATDFGYFGDRPRGARNIEQVIQTPFVNHGTARRKKSMCVRSDRLSSTGNITMSMRDSQDQSFGNSRTISVANDETQNNFEEYALGSYRQRQYKFAKSDGKSLSMSDLEEEYTIMDR